MDFTGIMLQDQYHATLAERERHVARDSWRRMWRRLTAHDATPPCCATELEQGQEPAKSRSSTVTAS